MARSIHYELPPINFYVGPEALPSCPIPDTTDCFWSWLTSNITLTHHAPYPWIVLTYLRLKDNGFPCKMVTSMPEEGIVIAYTTSLRDDIQPTSKQLFVCVMGDQNAPNLRGEHPYSHIYVFQNRRECAGRVPILFKSYRYMPHWPQPSMIPRDPQRLDRFENIAVFGYGRALELQDASFQNGLRQIGMRLIIASRYDARLWNDYSNIDALLAERAFFRDNRWQAFNDDGFDFKPASKLFNAWHAGIPAVLGPESAYRAERRSELDYIEVRSLGEALEAFKMLKNDVGLRHRMVENGKIRALETSVESMTRKWEDLIVNYAVPAYYRWRAAPEWTRKAFIAYCDVRNTLGRHKSRRKQRFKNYQQQESKHA